MPRLVRLTILIGAAALVYFAGREPPAADPVSLEAAQRLFPEAALLAGGDPRLGGARVLDGSGRTLGLVLTTSPQADDLVGYAGPSNLLIGLDNEQLVIGTEILTSGDTQAHVDEVRVADAFWDQFRGTRPTSPPPRIEGVSGSTLTSLAMAEGVERRLRGKSLSLRFPEPVTLAEVQSLFPAAENIAADEPRSGWHCVEDAGGQTLGYAVRSSPYTDNGRGYRGPTEVLIAVAADGRTVVGGQIRQSYDTEEYVDRVREEASFWKLLAGRTTDEWASIDFREAGIEGVSGATQTSFAVADGMRRRFAADMAAPPEAKPNRWMPWLLVAVIAGGLLMSFSPLRANRRARTVWQGVLIFVFLFWLGDLVSLALLAGWARSGIPWQTAPAAVLLVAVALITPWTTRKQVYCQQLCPHGAAQTWLGRFKRLHVKMPIAAERWLTRLPLVLLAAGLLLAIAWRGFDLAWLEPFDAWVLKTSAVVSLGVAVVGLVASLFVPQAYCRFGCPTGELLRLVKSGGSHDRLTRRDYAAAGIVVVAALLVAGKWAADQRRLAALLPAGATNLQPIDKSATGKLAEDDPDTTVLRGEAFGTTWSVKIRGEHAAESLQTAVATELERIESTLSHWQPDSFTAQFNATETTFETEQPAELVALVSRALEISQQAHGAYDITVAPLVDAWGYGPSGPRDDPPTEAELAKLLARTGADKLHADPATSTLQKDHPQLAIDLGSLLQGHAADRIAAILAEQLPAAPPPEFLIDVGGELLARGAWTVAIENPREPDQPLRTLVLQDAALATSGLYRSERQSGAETVHHLISPRTGRPVAAPLALSAVIAPSAMDADAWATALLAVGLPDALTLADDEELAVLLVDPQDAVHSNPAGEARFGSP
jgi:NosR/NirI family nitrous oxide reductase transcriptional regulator